ncbi:MAG: alpha/beta hydrolase [Chloroflexi bacterium]|nr:alpha/beta hydrolase [Chloroflexota bacterium]
MQQRPFILIHSPLLGPLTWQPVADSLRAQGYEALTPELIDRLDGDVPLWAQQVASVDLPDAGAILVGHSGAGALLPAIGERLDAQAYIFVDAALLFEPATRLEMMHAEDRDYGREFERFLTAGGHFPNWEDAQLRDIIPDGDLRQRLLADMRPRVLSFFTERIEVPAGWDAKPCAYIQLSDTYGFYADQAAARQWPVVRRSAHHFEMLTQPAAIADLLVQMRQRLDG